MAKKVKYFFILIITLVVIVLIYYFYNHRLRNEELPQGYLIYSLGGNDFRKISIPEVHHNLIVKYPYSFKVLLENRNGIGFPDINTKNNYIAYVQGFGFDNSKIIIQDLSTFSTLTFISAPQGITYRFPSFAINGPIIAFLMHQDTQKDTSDNDWKLVIENLSNKVPHVFSKLSLAPMKPSWSPDNSNLLVTSNDSIIWVVNKDTEMKSKIGNGYGAIWSNDGKTILCYLDKHTIIAYPIEKDYQTLGSETIFHSIRTLDLSFSPIIDESGRFLFLHRNLITVYNLVSPYDYELIMFDTRKKSVVTLLRNVLPLWGMAYYPKKS